MKNIRSVALAVSTASLLTGPVPVFGDESIEELKAMIRELDQKVRVLERKQEQEKEALAEKAKSAPTLSAGANGFKIQSADTNFTLRVGLHLQADGRFYPGGPANNTFLLRKVRPIFEGTVFDKFDYRLMLDFGSGLTSTAANVGFVQEAYVNARLRPQFQIQAGKFKEPVGLERLQADVNTIFIERGYPTLLVPNRDVGVQLQGALFGGALNYAAGIFNGVADGGSGDFETNDSDKDFAGRVFAQPFKNTSIEPLRGFGFGVSGTIGNQKGPLANYFSPGQQRIFSYRSGLGTNAATANVSSEAERWRISPQAYYYWGPFGIFGEYVISSQEVRRDAGGTPTFLTLKNTAWQVAASYILTGEENSYRGITPNRPFSLLGGGLGAWEIAARVGELNLDQATFPLYANPATSAREAFSWALGLNWHLNKNLKLSLNYEQADFKGGKSNPITAKGEKVVLTRVQLAF